MNALLFFISKKIAATQGINNLLSCSMNNDIAYFSFNMLSLGIQPAHCFLKYASVYSLIIKLPPLRFQRSTS